MNKVDFFKNIPLFAVDATLLNSFADNTKELHFDSLKKKKELKTVLQFYAMK